MRKNGLTTAGMIVILSAAGVLFLTSLIALFSAKTIYSGDDWYFYYYGVHSYSYNSAAKSLSEVKIAMGCFTIFALLALMWAFKNKKATAITGIALASLSSLMSFSMFVTRISNSSNYAGNLGEVDSVWLAIMFIACIALLVGSILKLVGVIKLNKQLSQEN